MCDNLNIEIVDIDDEYGYAVLPAEWDDPEDEGLYDDLVREKNELPENV